jgi:hypothetical protein
MRVILTLRVLFLTPPVFLGGEWRRTTLNILARRKSGELPHSPESRQGIPRRASEKLRDTSTERSQVILRLRSPTRFRWGGYANYSLCKTYLFSRKLNYCRHYALSNSPLFSPGRTRILSLLPLTLPSYALFSPRSFPFAPLSSPFSFFHSVLPFHGPLNSPRDTVSLPLLSTHSSSQPGPSHGRHRSPSLQWFPLTIPGPSLSIHPQSSLTRPSQISFSRGTRHHPNQNPQLLYNFINVR